MVEAQVRTHLQGAWANLYEEAGDYFGRDIRYGGVPVNPRTAKIVVGLRYLSLERIAQMEQIRDSIYQSQNFSGEVASKQLREAEGSLIPDLKGLQIQLRTLVKVRKH
ncbi:hypothetical protein G7066_00575 [Leucobacter coleopterorum]|uniref:Uncharacterized protein n=1 Tax=Leucobacter coleopterorum TaxID=2714933 RepID=A0ABX6JTF2_9MICO|nr:hypothetical protein [Leucobacter coleopterorum]QIM17575.1 hypothetical protein G7066_00575 [Leucobacter coleopterorum]